MNNIYKGCVALTGLAGIISCQGKADTPPRPNIIYILADDLGYGDLSCYGQQRFSTPNLDRLAAQGMRFSDHYAGCPVSAPSRCALMTGVHTGHATIRENRSLVTDRRVDLLPEDVTIASMLRDTGYKTGIFGKWGLGAEGSDAVPNRKGFDRFVGFLDQRDAHNHFPPFLHWDEEKVTIPENQNGGMGVFANDIFTREAKDFIIKNKDNTFFIYLPYTIPHAELLAPEDDMSAFRDRFLPETPFEKRRPDDTYRPSEQPRAAFAAMITRMDRQIGEIMALLDELGIADNTVVMFSSDNGPHKEGGADPQFFNSAAGQRGIKRDLYEGGIRVPFIVRWPAAVAAGAVSEHPSAFWDIVPTLCELSGAAVPQRADGISIVPTLTGKGKQKIHEALYWEYPRPKQTSQAVRIGDFKVIRNDLDLPVEVYNIKADYAERNDIAGAHPELVARAEGLFVTMRTPSPDFPVPALDGRAK